MGREGEYQEKGKKPVDWSEDGKLEKEERGGCSTS